jgi:hypothetical protein
MKLPSGVPLKVVENRQEPLSVVWSASGVLARQSVVAERVRLGDAGQHDGDNDEFVG